MTDPVAHVRSCAEDPDFYLPVAPWKAGGEHAVPDRIEALLDLGYKAVKVHPRFGGPDFGSDEFLRLADRASASSMTLFVCTYPFGPAASRLGDHILSDLEVSLAEHQALRLVLLHSGGPDLLRYAEFARANRNQVLLDLSLTLMKYAGSSIDLDIAFVTAQFDQRISFGSDYPWYTPEAIEERVAPFLDPLPREKVENCLSRSALSFLNLPIGE